MKVAIVYDRVNKWGGAERLLLSIGKIFPNADLYTSVLNERTAPWAGKFKKIHTSFIQDLPLSNFHQFYASLMPLAFEGFDFDKYDLVISVTSEAAKGIITKPWTKHISICLTPTRYLWSGYSTYFSNPLLRLTAKPIILYLRYWDKIASQRPDKIISISKEVQKRVKKYYGRDSEIIYPALNLEDKILKDNEQRDYFLIVSRLVPYKKLDIAIRAFNKTKLPLKVVGTGSQSWFLKLISRPNIKFLGNVSDRELAKLYSECRALVFPGVEDFGLTMAEAQSFGAPVIAYRGGGALDIVREGQTGEFFESQNPSSLVNVLEKWDDKRYNRSLCIENSRRFSFETFKMKLLKVIQ